MNAIRLKTEHLFDPLGIDIEHPRLMWNCEGVTYRCEVYPGVDHGVGPGTGTAAEGWIARAVEFWRAQ